MRLDQLDEQFKTEESASWARLGLEYPQLPNEDHPFAHEVTSGKFRRATAFFLKKLGPGASTAGKKFDSSRRKDGVTTR
jgi:hypothetical protein